MILKQNNKTKKKFEILLLAILTTTFFLTSSKTSFAWLQGFNYRIPINISANASTNNYSLAVNITYNSHMKSDFSDLRFTTSSDELLNYYIEEQNNNTNAYVWVLIPNLTNTTIYVYYNNVEATSQSNPNQVFLFFDDFLGTTLNTSKWAWHYTGGSTLTITNSTLQLYNPSNNGQQNIFSNQNFSINSTIELKYLLKNPYLGLFALSTDYNPTYPCNTANNATYSFLRYRSGYNTNLDVTINNASQCSITTTNNPTSDVWYVGKIILASNTQKLYRNNTQLLTCNVSMPNTNNYKVLIGSMPAFDTAMTLWVDWVRVRKYVNPEPTTSFLSEEAINESINIITYTPNNNTYNQNYDENETNINFTYNINVVGNISVVNCSLLINNQKTSINDFNISQNTTTQAALAFGFYEYNISCTASNNKTYYSLSTKNFLVNKQPLIQTIFFNETQKNNFIINYSIIDLDDNTNNCSLYLNNTLIKSQNTPNNTQTQFNTTFNDGINYEVKIICDDAKTTAQNTSAQKLTINNAKITFSFYNQNNEKLNLNQTLEYLQSPYSLTVPATQIVLTIKKTPLLLQYVGTCGQTVSLEIIDDFTNEILYSATSNTHTPNLLLRVGVYKLNFGSASQGINNDYFVNDEYVQTNNWYKTVLSNLTFKIPTINFSINNNSFIFLETNNDVMISKLDLPNILNITTSETQTYFMIKQLLINNNYYDITNTTQKIFLVEKNSINPQKNNYGVLNIPTSINIQYKNSNINFNITYTTNNTLTNEQNTLCYNCSVLNTTTNTLKFQQHKKITYTINNDVYAGTSEQVINAYHSNNTLIFKDENTLGMLNLTHSTQNRLLIICEEGINEYNVNTNYYNITINCNSPRLKFYQTYDATTYYRQQYISPSTTNQNITYYMADLTTTNTIIQTLVFEGLQTNDYIRIYDGVRLITEENPDFSGAISLLLIQNHEYILQLVRNNSIRVLGNLLADFTGTKIIRINNLQTNPNENYSINENVIFSFERNENTTKIFYYDKLNNTQYVYCNITNTTNTQNANFENIVYNNNNITFTWIDTLGLNNSIIINCKAYHTTFGLITKTYLIIGNESMTEGITLNFIDEGTKKLFALIIITTITLITATMPTIAISLFVGSLTFFNFVKWVSIPTPVLSLIIISSIIYILIINREAHE